MNYTGKITHIGEIETVGQNSLQKRTVVLEEVNQSLRNWTPGGIAFDLLKDKVTMIDSYDVGDIVDVSLNFRTSEYNGRYFTNIGAWSIKLVGGKTSVIDDSEGLPF